MLLPPRKTFFPEHLAARLQWSRLQTKNRWEMLRPLCAISLPYAVQQTIARHNGYSITSSEDQQLEDRPALHLSKWSLWHGLSK
jgi:hypothetical protein